MSSQGDGQHSFINYIIDMILRGKKNYHHRPPPSISCHLVRAVTAIEQTPSWYTN
jgi:hypothetical protein